MDLFVARMGAMIRVFILSKFPLFGQGVARLLSCEAGIEVVGQGTNTEKAIARIRDLRADAVILDHNDVKGGDPSVVVRILQSGICSKVIGLNLDENTLHVYCGEQRQAGRVEDLVHALKTSLSHNDA
jgi:DNA-binding NarL/FixJ family response regulator